MRIVFVIPSLRCGGAERVAAVLTREWIAKGAHEIAVLTFSNPEEMPFYELDDRVTLVPLGIDKVRGTVAERCTKNVRRVRGIRSFLLKWRPDLIVASMERANFAALLASVGLGIPVVVTEHGVPFVPDNERWMDMFLRRLLYPLAARVVVLTEEIAEYYRGKMRVPTVVIPNPVLSESTPFAGGAELSGRESTSSRVELVAVGRLEKVKGFDVLLRVMAEVVREERSLHLTIWGEGKERPELERLRSELSLGDYVSLPGRTERVDEKLQQSDIFVMSSHHEAFPNALLEAQAAGLPIISFSSPSGPRVIVRNEIDGLLVPEGNVQAMARAILRLIRSPEERRRFASATAEVHDRFGLSKIATMWEQLFTEVR